MTPAHPPSPGTPRRAGGDEEKGWSTARKEMWGGLDQSSLMTVELLSGVLVWGGAGWLLDRWLGTWPWLFAIGVFAGFGAGLYLIWIRAVAAQRRFEEERLARLVAPATKRPSHNAARVAEAVAAKHAARVAEAVAAKHAAQVAEAVAAKHDGLEADPMGSTGDHVV